MPDEPQILCLVSPPPTSPSDEETPSLPRGKIQDIPPLLVPNLPPKEETQREGGLDGNMDHTLRDMDWKRTPELL